MRSISILVVAAIGPHLAGCHEPEPAYPASVVEFDERVVGRWRAEVNGQENLTVEITVSPRSLEVADGRVQPEPMAEAREGPAGARPPNAFVAQIVVDSPADDGGRERAEIEVKGFMLHVEGEHYLAFQPSAKQLNVAHLGGLVLPIHQVVKVRCDGDGGTVWAPRAQFGWLPDATWLDAPREPLGEPDLGDWPQGPRRVTLDIDRFLAVLRKYGRQEGFWGDSLVFQRVE